MAHAKLSPSGAERWMTCPGSTVLSEGEPRTSSEYADEGTAAHFLGQHCLETGDHPAAHIGKRIVVWEHPESDDAGCEFSEEFVPHIELDIREFGVSAEFAGHVNVYVQLVRTIASVTGGVMLVEQALPIGHLTGEEYAEGTSDAVILAGDEIIVIDLKFGQGVEVPAEKNKQLMIYALGALEKFKLVADFKRVRMIISQPRVSLHPSEWDCSVQYLLEFAEGVTLSAADCAQAKKDYASSTPEWWAETYLAPTDRGCKWCSAKATCPSLSAFVKEAIAADFDDLTAPLTVDYDPEELAIKMKAVPLIEQWVSSIRGKVEADLFQGKPVPGFKLVRGKMGNRQWSDPEAAEQILKTMKVKEGDMYDKKVISPTSAEKLFKAGVLGPKQWPKVEELIVRKEGQPSVAPESDKRPALVLAKPEDDFEDLTAASEKALDETMNLV